jgi:hypothetical protein
MRVAAKKMINAATASAKAGWFAAIIPAILAAQRIIFAVRKINAMRTCHAARAFAPDADTRMTPAALTALAKRDMNARA